MDASLLPGKRIYKTAIAVGICLLITSVFKLSTGFYMTVATVLTMKTTSEKSIAYGKSRIEGTVVGGMIGLLMILIFQYFKIEVSSIAYIILNMIGVIACIWIAKLLKREDVNASSACVVLFTITINRVAQSILPIPYVVDRVLETIAGIVVAVVVNISIWKDEPMELEKEEQK